ncbi:DNA-directed RNA polymerase specialized sigma24 family protein [Streptomyces sp. SAI-170]|uniref:RNA polymerase sigma factor n=1 Tax=Streptomyces sp. SAI-170 TaxID=3377729 RepID=UPI003C7B0380
MPDDQFDGAPQLGAQQLPAARTGTDVPESPLFRMEIEADSAALARLAEKTAAETSRRAADDAAVYEVLAAAQFDGPAWNLFARALTEYACPIVTNWLYTGEIFTLCADRGRPVRAPRTQQDMETLRTDPDEREELVCEVVARALHLYRRCALAGTGWRPDGGASLKSYFVGAVLGEFAEVFGRWASERARRPPCEPDGMNALQDVAAHRSEEPESQAIGHDAVQRLLAEVKDETTRTALFLMLRGYTRKEIGEFLNLSAAAVAMRMSRLRKNRPQHGGQEEQLTPSTARDDREDA